MQDMGNYKITLRECDAAILAGANFRALVRWILLKAPPLCNRRTVPAFKITRMVVTEMICPNRQLLEYSLMQYEIYTLHLQHQENKGTLAGAKQVLVKTSMTQMHAAVLLHNCYHWKQYLQQVHDRGTSFCPLGDIMAEALDP